MPQFVHQANVFHSAKAFFDVLAILDADLIPFVAGGAAINRRMFLLRHMRRHFTFAAIRHKGFAIVILVRPQRPWT